MTELGADRRPAERHDPGRGRAFLTARRRPGRAPRRLDDGREVPEPRDPARRPGRPTPGSSPLRLARARARAELRDCPGARHDLTDGRWPRPRRSTTAARSRRPRPCSATCSTRRATSSASAKTLDDAVARWRELDDPLGLGDALRFRGLTDLFRANPDERRRRHRARRSSSSARSATAAARRGRCRTWRGSRSSSGHVRRGRAPARRVGHRVRRARRLGRHELGARPARVGPLHAGPPRGGRGARRADPAGGDRARQPVGRRRSCACCSPTSRSGGASPADALEYATEARAVFQELGDPWGELQSIGAGDARAQRAAARRPRRRR